MTTNNAAKQTNSWLGPLRLLPIVPFVQGIYNQVMQAGVRRLEQASLLGDQHITTPWLDKQREQNGLATRYEVLFSMRTPSSLVACVQHAAQHFRNNSATYKVKIWWLGMYGLHVDAATISRWVSLVDTSLRSVKLQGRRLGGSY